MSLKTFAMAHVLFVLAAPVWAQVTVDAPDIGEIYQTNTATVDIAIANTGSKPVRILGIAPRNATDVVGPVPAHVAPKSTVQVSVRIPIGMQAGKQQHVFIVKSSLAGKQSETQVRVRAFGLSVLDEVKPAVDLGAVEFNAPPKTHILTLSSREVADFRVEKILEAPPFVTARLLADGHSVSIAGNPRASWGRHQGYVKVKLNAAVQPQAWIAVTADIHGAVVASVNPVELGVLRSTRQPFMVQLKSRDGRPVKLGKMTIDGFNATVTPVPCASAASDCAQIDIRLADDLPGGAVQGTVWVDLPDFQQRLPIEISGTYLPRAVPAPTAGVALQAPVKSTAKTTHADLQAALQHSGMTDSLPPPVDPPGQGPLLKWQTSNEVAVYGYLIYRSDNEHGPFLRMNKQIVRVIARPVAGASSSYSWRDTSATLGKSYWYYIGLINTDGSKQQLSGPQKVVAK